jgi:WD40 repeat protein
MCKHDGGSSPLGRMKKPCKSMACPLCRITPVFATPDLWRFRGFTELVATRLTAVPIRLLSDRRLFLVKGSPIATALLFGFRRGQPLAITGGEGTLLLWDLTNGRLAAPSVQTHTRHVTAVAVADLDDVGIVVSAGADGLMKTWNLAH